MKNKVLQFFKLNDRVYEEFYSVGKETDFHDDNKIDTDGSIDWEFPNTYMPSMVAVKFAPNFGKSYWLIATWDTNYKIDFWKLHMSEYKELPKQNSLLAGKHSIFHLSIIKFHRHE